MNSSLTGTESSVIESRVPPERAREPSAHAGTRGAAPRVLHILGELRPSGAEVMLRIAAPYWFADANSQALLATGKAEGVYASTLKAAGFEIYHIPFRRRVRYFVQVFALIRRGRYDAVHIHTEQAHLYYGMAAKLAGVDRIIYTIHNVYPFTGWLRLVRIAMRRGLWLMGATPVAIGPSVAENERQNFWNRALLIPNWYDTDEFRPPSPAERAVARHRYGVKDGRTVIATMANCNEWKNHPLLFQALKLLLEKRNDWFYLHAGGEDERASERALAVELGVADSCSFLGMTSDPRSVFWAADVFVMPSTREGLGNAAIEAAACGLPLVLTDVPGLRDLKASVPDGFWVPLDSAALAEAIEAANLRFPSGSPVNAASAPTYYGVEAGAKAYLDLYNGARPLVSGQTQSPLEQK